MRTFIPDELPGREGYFLLTSMVVPRPIAWVSSLSAAGHRNLAPHSYFNAISSEPLIVHFTSTGVKDTLRNVRETGEFVINIVSRDLVEEMNLTAADFPPEEDEFEWAHLDGAPSEFVAPERVARAKVAIECTVNHIHSLGNGHMVFGDVRCVHVQDDVLSDGRIDPHLLKPVGRLGGSLYSDASAEIFKLPRPSWEGLKEQPPAQR